MEESISCYWGRHVGRLLTVDYKIGNAGQQLCRPGSTFMRPLSSILVTPASGCAAPGWMVIQGKRRATLATIKTMKTSMMPQDG